MEHNITSLAKKTRVTVRTLRHYDQIGLLKPSIRMANGKRIYSDEEFMRLIEIVFLKKIGISLTKIKEIFRSKDFPKATAAALMTRKQALAKEIRKLHRYVTSIETVLPQYKNCTMTQKERLEKFSSWLHTAKEIEEMQIKEFGKDSVEKTEKKIEALSDEQVDEFSDRSNKLMKALVKAVEQGLDPSSKEVQEIIKGFYDLTAEFNPISKEIFLKFRDAALEQRECYEAYHPNLPEFLYKALDVFANRLFLESQE